jgi:hypothetical protein
MHRRSLNFLVVIVQFASNCIFIFFILCWVLKKLKVFFVIFCVYRVS